MTLASWLLVLGVYQLTESVSGRFGWVHELPVDVPTVLLVAMLVLPAYPLVLRLNDASVATKWLTFLIAALIIAAVQSAINILENRYLGVIPRLDAAHAELIRTRFARMLQNHFYKTFANITLIAFTVQVQDRATDRVKLAELAARADRARLAALRLQLNPHFLFNTLNAISALVGARRADEADEMIERLSDFLRQTLEEGDAIVPLSQELATLDSYIAVERIRFGDRMQIEVDVDRALRQQQQVPSLILQPLVENAIKYAVATSRQTVTVRLSGRRDGDTTIIEVSDDGVGVCGEPVHGHGLGIGLANVRQRLDTVYGSAARFDAGARPAGGWVARLHLPLAPPALG